MSIPKTYSLKTKITICFTILGLFLLSILFIQIIPNMKEEQKKSKKNQIENMITITNEQLKLAVSLLIHSREARISEIKSEINTAINSNKMNSFERCEFYSLNKAKNILSKDQFSILKENELVFYNKQNDHMCPKIADSMFYFKVFSNNKKIVAQCNPKLFENKHINLEENIKNDLQKSFQLTNKDHKGKINLIWVNTGHKDYDSKAIYDKKDEAYNSKYCISKMSIIFTPQTGNLTAKEIVEASNKEPIIHTLQKDKKAFTWVKTLKDMPNKKLLFLTTIYKEDFNNDLTSPLLKVLPATILSFLIVIGLGFFLFKNLFKSINILTNTAKKIDEGNINLRSGIKGNDDIAILAKTFDNMLDSIEKNINELDKKVEVKTKELRISLEEKEILLKEIHHRVKNNLAMTINLIKLQKSKIDDKNVKNSLTNIQERVFTMELLHRKLYESKDLNSISFKKYILELLEDLHTTYGSSKEIKINTDIEDISMNIEYALPCGLIITECITNAYKYAFKNNEGEINISFKISNNKCTLEISDNGQGLDDNIDINNTKTLGLRLISSIVKGQLFGEFLYKEVNGSKFIISFDYFI